MTASEHTLRRLGRLSRYGSFANHSDDENGELTLALEDALAVFLDYTNRVEDPGQPVDSLIIDIAKTLLVRSGAEGVTKAKDGEMMREWSDANGGLDIFLRRRMNAYRLVVGLNAPPKL